MEILFYQKTPPIHSTLLTWTLCEELQLLGHHVDYGKYQNGQRHDWVHGAGTDSWRALNYARKIGAKCHIHLEGVAYWRVGYENAVDWGYGINHTQAEINTFRNQYISWMSAAFEADSCTVNGVKQIKAIEWLFGKKLPNCHTITCGADARFGLTLKEYPRQDYMVTVSRLEPNKKVFKIAEALAILKKRGVDLPKWVIIGMGSPSQFVELRKFLNDNSIDFDLKTNIGLCAEKWSWIKRARLMLCGWMGIPPAEGIVCGIPVLSFDNVDIVEMFDDTIWFAEDNNIGAYADKIEFLLDPKNQNEINTKNAYAFDRLLDRDRHGRLELYANTQERAALRYEKIFMEGM